MARCGCSSSTCNCQIIDGDNTEVAGNGTSDSPYQINVTVNDVVITVGDTPTIDMSIVGTGTPVNPFLITANRIGQGSFLDAFQGARQAGMTPAQALAVASAVNDVPPGFNPVTQVFTPLGVSYVTPLTADFTRTVAAAANVYEKITELADLIVVEPGVYLVSYSARVAAAIPTGTAAVNTGTVIGLHRNNVLVPNTESRGALVSQGAAATTEPVLQVQGTSVSQAIVTCAANDALSLYVKRTSATAGTVNSVNNDDGGRVKITAVRIRL